MYTADNNLRVLLYDLNLNVASIYGINILITICTQHIFLIRLVYSIFLKDFGLVSVNRNWTIVSKQAICVFDNSRKQFSSSRSRRNYQEFSTKHLWESGKGVFQLEIRSSEKFHVTFIIGNWIAAKSKENIETLLGIRWVFFKWKKYGKLFHLSPTRLFSSFVAVADVFLWFSAMLLLI